LTGKSRPPHVSGARNDQRGSLFLGKEAAEIL
jgi:hypothetical protein